MIKKIRFYSIIMMLVGGYTIAFSQNDSANILIDYLEVTPVFPDGDIALHQFIKDKLQYPIEAVEQEIEGRVILQFIVETNGEISNIDVKKSLDPACDSAAVRLIRSMPNWKPATQNNIPVRANYWLAIKFDLQEYKEKYPDFCACKDSIKKLTDSIYIYPSQLPRFPGGDLELLKYLQKKLYYPSKFQESGIQGRVLLRFIVTPSGNITCIQLLRSLDPGLDKIAIEAIKSMPNWIPAEHNGKTVYTYYSLPVFFGLSH